MLKSGLLAVFIHKTCPTKQSLRHALKSPRQTKERLLGATYMYHVLMVEVWGGGG